MEGSLEMCDNGPQRSKVLFVVDDQQTKKVLMWPSEGC